jgi:hypothetical protein
MKEKFDVELYKVVSVPNQVGGEHYDRFNLNEFEDSGIFYIGMRKERP